MKANELMIGDWVLSPTSEPYRVAEIHRKAFTTDISNGELYEVFPVIGETHEVITPIPLTPEILEKNGFVGDFSSAYAYGKKGAYLIDLYAAVGEIRIYDEKGHYSSGYVCRSINVPSLHYVHELQHAFRLCGLTELADNFEI